MPVSVVVVSGFHHDTLTILWAILAGSITAYLAVHLIKRDTPPVVRKEQLDRLNANSPRLLFILLAILMVLFVLEYCGLGRWVQDVGEALMSVLL